MSRQAQLPPRCPFHKKAIPHPIHEPISPWLQKDYEPLPPRHHKSSSQSSILEEQPDWLDDLLGDSDSNTKGILHRRSASDSVTLLDGIVDQFSSLTCLKDEENSIDKSGGGELESACMYGPNSPRRRGNLTFSENAIVSALSEYVSQNPVQNVDSSCVTAFTCVDLKGDGCGSACELNAETKTVKRHPGQRSRVRKLQYIAELERTVNVFQTLESELAARVASLFQQRVVLSMENSKLKQQMARLQQEKHLGDGQYQSLRKEFEQLKVALANSSSSEGRTSLWSSSSTDAVRSDPSWQMLDMGKLNLS